MKLKEANQEERKKAIELLEIAKLPTNDISEAVKLYILEENQNIIATGGLEIFENLGLLRSVSVIESEKGKGYGKMMTSEVEKAAKILNISEIYLLTTTAKGFFEKKESYEVVERNSVPETIKNSNQFSSSCPSSATLMRKKL